MNVCSRVSAVILWRKKNRKGQKKTNKQQNIVSWFSVFGQKTSCRPSEWCRWLQQKQIERCRIQASTLLFCTSCSASASLTQISSVHWSSGLYNLLSNVSVCFLEGLIHTIILSSFVFYYRLAETGRVFVLFFFNRSTDPRYQGSSV